MHVRNVAELTAHPNGRVRISHLSLAPSGHIELFVKGARRGKGEVFGTQVDDYASKVSYAEVSARRGYVRRETHLER